MKRIFKITALFLLFFGAVSCDDKKEYPWNPDWDTPQTGKPVEPETTDPETTDPEKPDPEEPDPEEPESGFKGKPRYIWIDAAANFKDYANNKENIAKDLKRLAQTGFTDVIVDVRPSLSGVLFKSNVEEALTRVTAWTGGTFQWLERTAEFDYLQAFIDEGHKAGLRVNAAMNTFVGGSKQPFGMGTTGMLFNHPERKDWATVINTTDGLKNVMDLDEDGTRFLNPAHPEVVKYLLDLIGELASYKDLDGIVLDRCRFDDHNLQSDFSSYSKKGFEQLIGKSINHFPSDIFSAGASELSRPVTDMQKRWLEFRAKTIHDFIVKASEKVHQTNPKIRFGAYVGGWYSSYYYSGVNWASPKYDPAREGHYNWASPNYKDYGYADHCDFMFIGAYAGTNAIWGNGEWSMQGFCKNARNLFKGDVTFAGGPDIGNGSGFENGGCSALLPDITNACINAADGLFIFDLIHLKMYDYWDGFKIAFDKYLNTIN